MITNRMKLSNQSDSVSHTTPFLNLFVSFNRKMDRFEYCEQQQAPNKRQHRHEGTATTVSEQEVLESQSRGHCKLTDFIANHKLYQNY